MVARVRERAAEALRLCMVDPVHGQVITDAPLSGWRSIRVRTDQPAPLALSGFVLRGPEPSRQRDVHRLFIRAASRLARRTPHPETPGRTPAERNVFNLTLVPRAAAAERPLRQEVARRRTGRRSLHAEADRGA